MRSMIAVYGNVQIPRVFCRDCQQWGLVVRGIKQCCDEPAYAKPKRKKRFTSPALVRKRPSCRQRELLLRKYQNACAYCERLFGSYTLRYGKDVRIILNWDHQVPWVYAQDNRNQNFLPACRWCNGWKSDKLFQTVEEVKVYVALQWEKAKSVSSKV